MKAPKSVRILGNVLTIKGVDPGPMGLASSGLNDLRHQKIYYDTDWSPDKVRETVWHEMIHEVDEQCYLKLKERQVHSVAALTLAMLRDNPRFVDWLLAKG